MYECCLFNETRRAAEEDARRRGERDLMSHYHDTNRSIEGDNGENTLMARASTNNIPARARAARLAVLQSHLNSSLFEESINTRSSYNHLAISAS